MSEEELVEMFGEGNWSGIFRFAIWQRQISYDRRRLSGHQSDFQFIISWSDGLELEFDFILFELDLEHKKGYPLTKTQNSETRC